MDPAAKPIELGIDFQSISLFEDALQIRNIARIVKTLNYDNMLSTLNSSKEESSGVFRQLLEATVEYYEKIATIENSQS